jgi:ketosteroid isomerase-like protein
MTTDRLTTLDRYMDGFRHSDHAGILACLTDDVVWDVHGVRTTHGKAEFDDEIENPVFEGSPELTVDRTLESGDVVITTGTGAGHLRGGADFRFVFSDLFTFRGDLIARVESYVVPVT